MSETNNGQKTVSLEEVWNAAKNEGYPGTLEEFEAMCMDITKNESLDLESLDKVAGGSGVGEWFEDHWEAVVAFAGGLVTVGTIAGFATYKKMQQYPVAYPWQWINRTPFEEPEICD